MSPAGGPLDPAGGSGGPPDAADTVFAEIGSAVERCVPPKSGVCVGYSGGLDSTVLLHALAEIGERTGRPVTALHVHHGLSPNADQWVRTCERFCANQGVALTVEHVRVDRDSPMGTEAAARIARYAVYAGRSEPFMALAHHLDDQAETVLLQLMRGTGIKGIGAMPELRPLRGTPVQIFRPMLDLSRGALVDYAHRHALRWIEDESNANTRHDRNYLRHDIAPLVDARYPGWREAIARFARHAGTAAELLDQLAAVDGVPGLAGEPLPVDAALSPERRANALRAFLARNAVAMPSEARVAEMARQLFEAREDAQVRIDHAGVALMRHRGQVVIERGLAPAGPWRVEWRRQSDVTLPDERGMVHFEPARGEGIAVQRATQGGWYFCARSGGETIRLGADRPTRTLKNLLQEKDVPAWQREKLPLLFHDGRLVWIPGIGISSDYACAEGEEGLKPSWRVAGKAPLC